MIRSFETHTPVLGHGAWVDEQALVLGEVSLGADASVWPMAAVRGDVHRITVGARSNIQDNSTLHVTHDGPYSPGGQPLVVGEDVTPLSKPRVKIDWLFSTFRVTVRQTKSSPALRISAPGRRPVSQRIWKPLQTPITGAPAFALSMTARMIGDFAAIAPALR